MAVLGGVSAQLLASLCLLLSAALGVNADRVKNKIYRDIQGDMACFKRFNGTHEIGCTSKFYGNLGVVHVVRQEEDLQWVYQRGPYPPYVLALLPPLMRADVLKEAHQSGKVSGVILMVEESFEPSSMEDGYSGDHTCPNEEVGMYSDSANPQFADYCQKNPWNPNGTSLLYMNWNFPIFLVNNQTSINDTMKCFKEFNEPGVNGEPRTWPLCCMELKSNMFGTTNTDVCMRRRALAQVMYQPVNFCDPLYDYNIWGTLMPMNSSETIPEKSVIVVATRMDAATMFDNISPGANSAVSGLVTLMVAAEAIYKKKRELLDKGTDKNVFFVIFQGETWDYIGSSRLVWDMEKGRFPFQTQRDEADQMSQIKFTHIHSFIELAQVGQGMASDLSKLYLHTDPISNSDADIKSETEKVIEFLQMAANKSEYVSFNSAGDVPLPPASLQSFLKRVNISGVVITDHKEEFKNKFYESIFDDYRNVNYNGEYENETSDRYHKHISHAASVIATAVYSLLTDSPSPMISVNETLANKLLYCYMKNISCQMFREFGERLVDKFFNDKPAKMYVSVKRGESGRTIITNSIFASILGDKVNMNKTTCKTDSFYQINQFYYFSSIDNGTCYQSTVRKTKAMSPAFLLKDYDWQSGEYSTWTESGWQVTELRIFLKPSVMEEVGLVIGGIVSLLLSLWLIYFMNSRADILFCVVNPPAAC